MGERAGVGHCGRHFLLNLLEKTQKPHVTLWGVPHMRPQSHVVIEVSFRNATVSQSRRFSWVTNGDQYELRREALKHLSWLNGEDEVGRRADFTDH